MTEDTTKNTTQDDVQEPQIEEVVAEEVVEEPTVSDDVTKTYDFKAGDTIRISYKIIEGDKVRTQPYEGIVISRKGMGKSKTFTVRRIGADNIGVERIFPLFSPNIEKIVVMKRGKVRKSKLYYLRKKLGREAMRVRELGK
jgi:large subunit ribosomal protein L19